MVGACRTGVQVGKGNGIIQKGLC